MQFFCDRAGYPVAYWPEQALSVTLLPVLKPQFERFLAEPDSFNDDWYSELLRLNPRVPCHQFDQRSYHRMILSGVFPSEALRFAQWLDPGCDLPTVAEWRALYGWLDSRTFDPTPLRNCALSHSARLALQQLIQLRRPKTWGDLALLREGVFEWVHASGDYAALGTPARTLLPNVVDPLSDDPVRVFANERLSYVGFRLVRRHRAAQPGTPL